MVRFIVLYVGIDFGVRKNGCIVIYNAGLL